MEDVDKEEYAMLKALGFKDVEELFTDIPKQIRCGLSIEKGMTEMEVMNDLTKILGKNKSTDKITSFLGAGVYNHYIPAAVGSIVSRSEFYTSYTPYQSEASQGMLQALFEYQDVMCELTGMDAANTSMYDGATALGEACLMAHRINRKKEIIVPKALSWERRDVLRNYCKGPGMKLKEVDFEPDTGRTNLERLANLISDETSCVYIENPNFFGVLEEDLAEVRRISEGKVLIVGVNPLSLAVLRPPSDFSADIVVGEGQSLGLSMNLGGPLLGVFACRKEYIRKMPGRVVAMTEDRNGKRAFCLALQTREQHIRRDKATSNICTNESLCALASVVHMSLLGNKGLQRLALNNMSRAKELMKRLNEIDGFQAPQFNAHHFNEFVVRSEKDWFEVNSHLLKQHIHGGLPLKDRFPELGNVCLFAVTEFIDSEEIDKLVRALEVFG